MFLGGLKSSGYENKVSRVERRGRGGTVKVIF